MKAEVNLEGLSFYGYHGVYEEEQKAGNRFSVDLKITLLISDNADFDNLNNTVDYEIAYRIVKQHMIEPSRLLENLAKKILEDVFVQWKNIESAEVSISKFSPPIGGPCNRAKVTLVKKI
jgi:dihydroneopterin aldolase